MATASSTDAGRSARDALHAALRGEPLPGGPADYGSWASVVAAVQAAAQRGGPAEARRALERLTAADARLRRLLSQQPDAAAGDAPDDTQRATQARWLIERARVSFDLAAADSDGIVVPFARAKQPPYRCFPLHEAGTLRRWLDREYRGAHGGNPPSSDALTRAVHSLAADALSDDGAPVPAFVRVGEHDGKRYLDLGRPDWTAVEIAQNGWRIVERTPVLFRRSATTLPLPVPQRGGSIELLRTRGLLTPETDRDWLLLVGWIFCSLMSPLYGERPLLLTTGPHGTGKTTQTRIARSLVDPDRAATTRPTKTEDDLAIAATKRLIVALDNVSHISSDLSDALCRLSSGGALTTRQLYTNAEEHVLCARRMVVLNTIIDPVQRPDLADRLFLVRLARPGDGWSEERLWREFETVHPLALGALLDAAVVALQRWDAKRSIAGRLTDARLWVECGAPAFGWPPGAFDAAFSDMRSEMAAKLVDDSPLAKAIINLAHPNGWRGTAAQLHQALRERHGADWRAPEWLPKSSNSLGNALRRFVPELRATSGLRIDFIRQRDGLTVHRLIAITPIDREGEGLFTPFTSFTSPDLAHSEAKPRVNDDSRGSFTAVHTDCLRERRVNDVNDGPETSFTESIASGRAKTPHVHGVNDVNDPSSSVSMPDPPHRVISLPDGRVLRELDPPGDGQWVAVPSGWAIPPGLEVKLDLNGGRWVRRPPAQEPPTAQQPAQPDDDLSGWIIEEGDLV